MSRSVARTIHPGRDVRGLLQLRSWHSAAVGMQYLLFMAVSRLQSMCICVGYRHNMRRRLCVGLVALGQDSQAGERTGHAGSSGDLESRVMLARLTGSALSAAEECGGFSADCCGTGT